MKSLYSFALGIIMLCTSCAMQADNGMYAPRQASASTGDVDQQIAELQEQRRIYILRAEYFGREADRVFTQDWLAYKQYLAQQERYQDLADETDQKIKALQAKKGKDW